MSPRFCSVSFEWNGATEERSEEPAPGDSESRSARRRLRISRGALFSTSRKVPHPLELPGTARRFHRKALGAFRRASRHDGSLPSPSRAAEDLAEGLSFRVFPWRLGNR